MKTGSAAIIASIAAAMLLVDALYSKKEAGKNSTAQNVRVNTPPATDTFLNG